MQGWQMKTYFRIPSIKSFNNTFFVIVISIYLGVTIPWIIFNGYQNGNASKQLLLKHISNDVSLSDFRFAEQKYLAVCKIIKINRLGIVTDKTRIDLNCPAQGFFNVVHESEFNKAIFTFFYEVDIYIFYVILNVVLSLLVGYLGILLRKIELQKLRVIELKKTQLESERLIFNQVAHDIRSPLSVLNLIAPTLGLASTEKSELIMQSVERINNIAEDLLNKGKVSNRLGKGFEIVGLLEKILREKKSLSGDKVVFKLIHNSNRPTVKIGIEEENFLRIISNILNNSIEALVNQQGKILLEVSLLENGLILVIEDNGIGIPKEIQKEIGKKGFSYGKDSSINAGSGLGVFYCKEVVEKAGGTVTLMSNSGRGTRVEISLPYLS